MRFVLITECIPIKMTDKDTDICKINSLRVKDLQFHLEKRGIDPSGKKSVLVKKLKNALKSSTIDLNDKDFISTDENNVLNDQGNVTNVVLKRKKFIFQSEFECKYKKQRLIIKKLSNTVTKLKRELVQIRSKVNKLIKDRTNNTAGNSDKEGTVYDIGKEVISSDCASIEILNDKPIKKIADNGNKNCKNDYNNILILADSQGRSIGDIMCDKIEDYKVTCIFKPNAAWMDVINNIESLTANYGKSDYVVIWAGLNDALKGRTLPSDVIGQVLARLSHTNVIQLTVPLLVNRPVLNNFILNINNCISDATELCNHAFKVDINRGWLRTADFDTFGPHLRYTGKLKVVRAVTKFINSHRKRYNNPQVRKHINFHNLIRVSTGCVISDELVNVNCDSTLGGTELNDLSGGQNGNDVVSLEKDETSVSIKTGTENFEGLESIAGEITPGHGRHRSVRKEKTAEQIKTGGVLEGCDEKFAAQQICGDVDFLSPSSDSESSTDSLDTTGDTIVEESKANFV